MYKVINIIETGKNIKKKISDSGLTVTEIQMALELSAPQSIYRWFRGETLPSIDNLYTIAYILHVPMEALIVTKEKYISDEHIADIVKWAGNEAVESEKIRKAYWEVLGVLILGEQ